MKKVILSVALIASISFLAGARDGQAGNERSDVYTVKHGDTLWSIATEYREKNTYGRGDIREYIFNITHDWNREIFADRQNAEVYPGDQLHLKYWVKEDDGK